MKKSFAVITAFALVLVMLLTACGGNDDMTTTPNLSTSDTSTSAPESTNDMTGDDSLLDGEDDDLLDGEDDDTTDEKDDKTDDTSDKTDSE